MRLLPQSTGPTKELTGPQKKELRNKAKAEREREKRARPVHPYIHALVRKENLAVTIRRVPNTTKYEAHETWMKNNKATLMAMGYVPAKNYKSGWGDLFTKVYIRFVGFETYPCYYEDVDEKGRTYIEDAVGGITSGVLYDYFMSEAQDNFIKGMKAQKVSQLDMKKMGMIAMMAVGVVLGVFILKGGF